jgi:hypothetical protein
MLLLFSKLAKADHLIRRLLMKCEKVNLLEGHLDRQMVEVLI